MATLLSNTARVTGAHFRRGRREGPLGRLPLPAPRTVFLRGRCRALRAPESAHQQWGGSPHRIEHWLSVVEGNCVVERRGGRQPETNCQSINKTMLNTIRPDALASLRRVSEAQNPTPTREGQGNFGDLYQRRDSERRRRNAWGGW